MRYLSGDIWAVGADWVVVTTNGIVKKNGEAVMGRGIALQAARRYPKLPRDLGDEITFFGNVPHVFPNYKIITCPTKHDWKDDSDLTLIESSLAYIAQPDTHCFLDDVVIAIPPCGTGNGNLKWSQVKPLMERLLDDRFVLVSNVPLEVVEVDDGEGSKRLSDRVEGK